MSGGLSLGQGVSLGLATGFAFGVALEKSKVSLPLIIREQMLFRNNNMLKMFLSATIVGLLSFIIIEKLVGIKRKPKAPVAFGWLEGICKGFGGNVIGGLILGVGLTLSGACPGTVFSQLGIGVDNAIFTVFGALFGALAYGYLERILANATKGSSAVHGAKGPATTLDEILHQNPLATGLGVSAILAAMVVVAEYGRDFRDEFKDVGIYSTAANLTTLDLASNVWSPEISGVVIGLLQIPTLFLMNDCLGTSSSYCTLLGLTWPAVDKDASKHTPYLFKYVGTTKDYWQLALVVGISIGSLVSSFYSGVRPSLSNASALTCFVGGFLLLLGARIADGCTAGHGISGIAKLAISSFVTVGSMFLGAIGLAVLRASLHM